jgi:hypothetical protein
MDTEQDNGNTPIKEGSIEWCYFGEMHATNDKKCTSDVKG